MRRAWRFVNHYLSAFVSNMGTIPVPPHHPPRQPSHTMKYLLLSLLSLHLHNTNSLSAPMKTSVYISTTLDNYIATKSGSISFLTKYQQTATEADGDMGFTSFLSTVDLLIMGRR